MKRLMKSESGVALVFTLMVLVVLSVLGATIGTVAMANVNLTENERDYQAAYYIAEAGVNETYVNIEEIVHQAYKKNMTEAAFFDQINDEINDEPMAERNFRNFEEIEGMQPTAKVQVNYHDGDIIISSTSQLGEKSRTTEKNIKVKWVSKGSSSTPSIPANALFYIENNVKLAGQASIDGDIYAGGDIDVTNNAQFNGNSYEGSSYVDFETIRSYVNSIEAPKTGKDMIEISNSDLNGTYIAENAGKSSYDFNESSLKVDSGTVNLVFDNVSFNSDLRIEGSGVVNVFVKGSIVISKDKRLNVGGDPAKFNIFQLSDKSIELKNGSVVNGSLVIRSDNKIVLSQGEVSGGYLVAPNADVHFSGKSEVNTAIVAKSLMATGQFKSISTGDNSLPNPGGGSDSSPGNLSDLILSNPTYEK